MFNAEHWFNENIKPLILDNLGHLDSLAYADVLQQMRDWAESELEAGDQ